MLKIAQKRQVSQGYRLPRETERAKITDYPGTLSKPCSQITHNV